ncbi:major histocompatibility complex class I-related gene protein-like [Chanos chanos]|uniref:Major histocompatibility complex class I-related gene protein-like n=1 Tax=Chanos chanos TaxID=29144 RepID=A0A6J2WKZ3_CHACN|nr:major histocompatibility complex class I-related gene protein-like [Chanos chanos]
MQLDLLSSLRTKRHSLYCIYTALSKPVSLPGIHEFTAMGLLDDREIDYYNSQDKVRIPRQHWMKESLTADYWEKGTQSRKSKEQWFKVNIHILMDRMNHSPSDLHVFQWRHGCEAETHSDGSVRFVSGVSQYSYDGEDFLSFNLDTMQWVAPVPQALPTKRKWEDVPILNQYTKGYLEKECVYWLSKFMIYGEKDLKKHSPPEVYAFAKKAKSPEKLILTCMATGFYPKDITLLIRKNRIRLDETEPQNVMPNGDGTYQLRKSVEIPESEKADYDCSVNHRTLDQPQIAIWAPPDIYAFAKKAKSPGKLTLTCMATGFYAKDVTLLIRKNRIRLAETEPQNVMPNGDGTYQLRKSVEIPEAEKAGYDCWICDPQTDNLEYKNWHLKFRQNQKHYYQYDLKYSAVNFHVAWYCVLPPRSGQANQRQSAPSGLANQRRRAQI